MKGPNHSGFCLVSRRSRKTCDMSGLTVPMKAVMALVMATKSMAALAPRRRSRAKPRMEAGLPPGSKASVGSNCSATPVKVRSNSSSGILSSPRAGSFTRTLSPLKPRTTMKCEKPMWQMQGKCPLVLSSSGS